MLLGLLGGHLGGLIRKASGITFVEGSWEGPIGWLLGGRQGKLLRRVFGNSWESCWDGSWEGSWGAPGKAPGKAIGKASEGAPGIAFVIAPEYVLM